MTKLVQLYFNRLNFTRAAITNLFKIFKFQTSKALVFDTYGELKKPWENPVPVFSPFNVLSTHARMKHRIK
ncbi:MAG: hypothetical protein ACETWT_18415 [Thermodesulfobacteriota bacterium]